MRPPEFTGGNPRLAAHRQHRLRLGFNEAAGIHRRKHLRGADLREAVANASMRPPEFTGGNRETVSTR